MIPCKVAGSGRFRSGQMAVDDWSLTAVLHRKYPVFNPALYNAKNPNFRGPSSFNALKAREIREFFTAAILPWAA
jgi:hypothetical protein